MSLKRDFATGVVWSFIGNGANNLISFVVFAIIANVVSPTVLGVASFAIVLIELGRLLNTAGIPELLIQRPEWDDDYAAVAFWVNIMLSVVLTAVSCIIVAPLIDQSFAQGSGISLTVLSACFIIDAIRVVQEAKLRREFAYRTLAARGSIAGVMSGLVGVYMAVAGYGLWALIVQRLVYSALTTILTWVGSDWRPRFFWSSSELGHMLSNGSRLMAVGLLGTLSNRIPDLVIGAFLGPVALAVYRVGSRGYEALIQLIIWPVGNAATSGFSRISHGESMGRAYVDTTRLLALLGYPIFFGAAAIAQGFVSMAFGNQWAEASTVMAALCMIIGPSILGFMLRPALISLGQSKELLRINMYVAVTVAAASFAGLPFGAVGITIALAIRAYLAVFFNLWIVRRTVGVKPLDLLAAVIPAFVAGLIMMAATIVAGYLVAPYWPVPGQLAIMILTGAITYPLVLWLFWRHYTGHALKDIASVVPAAKKLLRRA